MTDAQTLQKAGKVKYGFVWQGASYEGTERTDLPRDLQHRAPNRFSRGAHGVEG